MNDMEQLCTFYGERSYCSFVYVSPAGDTITWLGDNTTGKVHRGNPLGL